MNLSMSFIAAYNEEMVRFLMEHRSLQATELIERVDRLF